MRYVMKGHDIHCVYICNTYIPWILTDHGLISLNAIRIDAVNCTHPYWFSIDKTFREVMQSMRNAYEEDVSGLKV